MKKNALLYHSGMAGKRGTLPIYIPTGFAVCLLLLIVPSSAQVIEFLSSGLKYQVLTRQGLTLMYAPLPLTVRDFAVLQIAFSNGSEHNWLIQSTDFTYETEDGRRIRAVSEDTVIHELFRNAGRSEVVKLQNAYEKSLFSNQLIRPTNGYELRRQAALAFGGHRGIKAAAAASTITFVRTNLHAGDSTDGAVFFDTQGKQIGPGKLIVTVVRAREGEFDSGRPPPNDEPRFAATFEFRRP